MPSARADAERGDFWGWPTPEMETWDMGIWGRSSWAVWAGASSSGSFTFHNPNTTRSSESLRGPWVDLMSSKCWRWEQRSTHTSPWAMIRALSGKKKSGRFLLNSILQHK